MDVEEVYLRQIDQKLKQNNDLQEEANKILKAIIIFVRWLSLR